MDLGNGLGVEVRVTISDSARCPCVCSWRGSHRAAHPHSHRSVSSAQGPRSALPYTAALYTERPCRRTHRMNTGTTPRMCSTCRPCPGLVHTLGTCVRAPTAPGSQQTHRYMCACGSAHGSRTHRPPPAAAAGPPRTSPGTPTSPRTAISLNCLTQWLRRSAARRTGGGGGGSLVGGGGCSTHMACREVAWCRLRGGRQGVTGRISTAVHCILATRLSLPRALHTLG